MANLNDTDQNTVTNIIQDGRILAVPLTDVAQFYNFEEVNQQSDEELPREDSSSHMDDAKSFVTPAPAEGDDNAEEPDTHYNSVTFFKWDNAQTNFLFSEYAKLIEDVGKFKRFRTKKLMMAHIAKKMGKVFNVRLSAAQCETRFKVVCKRKKAFRNKFVSLTSPGNHSTNGQNERASKDKSTGQPRRFLKKTDVVLVIPGKNVDAPDPFDVPTSRSPSPISSLSVTSPLPPLSPTRSMSPMIQSSDYRNLSGSERILQKMLDQANHNFMKYFVMKERRDEEKMKEKRRYNDEKLKILKQMAVSIDLKYRR